MVPLALLGAEAILAFHRDQGRTKTGRMMIILLFGFQLGFQLVATAEHLNRSEPMPPVPLHYQFRTQDHPDGKGEQIFQQINPQRRMVPILSPVRAIINGYQNMEYPQGTIQPGQQLVLALEGMGDPKTCQGRWLDFRSFQVQCRDPALAKSPDAPVKAIFNQNYYRHWSGQASGRNLALSTTAGALARGVTMTYTDPWAELGAKVSRIAILVWLGLLAGCGLIARARGSR